MNWDEQKKRKINLLSFLIWLGIEIEPIVQITKNFNFRRNKEGVSAYAVCK